MKRIIFLASILLVSLNLFGAYTTNELVDNFTTLVNYNKENNRNGNSHLNKYILVYTPGEEYNPAAVVNYDYIFEHPSGITPEGEYLNSELVKYNDNTTDNFDYQHYIIVINLTFVVQSKLNDFTGSEVNVPEWYKTFNGDEDVRDEKYYTDQKEILVQHFRDNFSFNVFDSGTERLISFFIVSHEHTAATGQKLIGNKKVELTTYGSTGNSEEFKTKWKAFNVHNRNNQTGESLSVIKSTISNYIMFFYYEDGLIGTDCTEIAARILYPDARAFFEARCNQSILDSDRKSFALYYSALYLEYLENIYQTIYNSNSNILDYDDTKAYVISVLDPYLNSTPSVDYNVHLRDEYDMYEVGLYQFKTNYHKVFYDITQPSKEILFEKIKRNVAQINTHYSSLNALTSFYPPIEFIEGVFNEWNFPSFLVEAAWKDLSQNFVYAASGAYSDDELKWLLNGIKNITDVEEVLYDKWLVGDGGGNFWKKTEQKIAGLNVSNFITRANIAFINTGLISLVDVHNVPFEYDDNYANGTPSSKELAGNLTKTISGDFSSYNYSIPLCKEFDLVTTLEDEDEAAFRKYIKVNQCVAYHIGQFNDIGFFDLVNLITLRNHFSYEDFCYEGDNQETWHNSKPVAGFYLAFSKDREFYDNLYEDLTLTIQIVGTLLTLGEAALATGVWRIVWGAFTVANVTSFYTINNYQAFEDDLKRWFADEQEAIDWAQSIQLINQLVLGAEAVVGVGVVANNYSNVFTSAAYKKAAAFSQMLDDAVGVVDPALLTSYNHLKSFGQGSLGIYKARNIDNVVELENIYYGLYGIVNHNRMLGPGGKSLRELILKARLGGAEYKNIHVRLNTLEDAGKLEKFVEGLVENPNLINYFSAASEAVILNRIQNWETLYDASKLHAIKSLSALKGYDALNTYNRSVAILYSDNAQMICTKFLQDCDQIPDFLTQVNNNQILMQSFAGYKPAVVAVTNLEDGTVMADRVHEFVQAVGGEATTAGIRIKYWYQRSVGLEAQINNFAKGDAHEVLNTGRIQTGEIDNWVAPGKIHTDYDKYGQVYLERNGGVGLNIRIDDLMVEQGQSTSWIRVILHDSKLSDSSPPTPNQLSELINEFANNPNAPFLEYISNKPSTPLALKNQQTGQPYILRVYKTDVYKTIKQNGVNVTSIWQL